MTVCFVDFETRSCSDVRDVGVHRYAEDPTTGIWCLCWAIDDEPVQTWIPGADVPTRLLDHVSDNGTVVAHGAMFERVIWNRVLRGLPELYGRWPYLAINQMDCTMARAQALALPRSLENLAEVLETSHQKDAEGHRLMMQMARPRRVHAGGEVEWWDTEDRKQRLYTYCVKDVETERECAAKLSHLSNDERELWRLDQIINDRGIHFDIPLINRMIQVRAVAARNLNRHMATLTDGRVAKASQVAKIKDWVNERGYDTVQSLNKEHHPELKKLFADDTQATRVLTARQEYGKVTSTAKLSKIIAVCGRDARARGQYNHHGASTGRVTGQLLQPTNFPRLDSEREGPSVAKVIEILEAFDNPLEAHDRIDLLVGDVLPWLSKALRPTITASPGHKLVGADLSNIEGRVNAWLAGEAWRLQAFEAQDRGEGVDLYKLSYHRSFGVPLAEIGFEQRQIGKVQELACGYQGSVNAYAGMTKAYSITRDDLAKAAALVKASTPWPEWQEAAEKYDRTVNKAGLPLDTWTGLKVIVNRWRENSPNIVKGWWELQDAAVRAVDNPGLIVPVYGGRVRYLVTNGFLWCQLPSGRPIAYAQPRLKTITEKEIVERSVWNEETLEYEVIEEEVEVRSRIVVAYEGVDGITKQWRTFHLYGGFQCENIIQATARDVHTTGLLAVESFGWPVVFHNYDELITEVPERSLTPQEFQRIMLTRKPWMAGLPLSAKGWEGHRYAK